MIVIKQLDPWSKGGLFFIKHSFVNEYTMYLSKFNYNVIFTASNLFHFVLFWYNQLNFLKLSLRKIMIFSLQKDILCSICFGSAPCVRNFCIW